MFWINVNIRVSIKILIGNGIYNVGVFVVENEILKLVVSNEG